MLPRKTYYSSSAMTTKKRELWYYYDRLDRLLSERALSSPFANLVTYTYDETTQTNGVGRLTTVTDTSGHARTGGRWVGPGFHFQLQL